MPSSPTKSTTRFATWLKPNLEHDIHEIYRADVLGNICWAMLIAAINSFALVIARRAGCGIGLISASVSIAYVPLLFGWLLPILCRRWPLGGVILGLRIIATAGILLCMWMPSLSTLIIGYIILTVASGLADTGYPAFFRVIYPADVHAHVMGLVFTKRSLASFIFLLLLGHCINHTTPSASIRLLGSLGLLGITTCGFTMRFRMVHEDSGGSQTQRMTASPWKNREFLRYLLALTVFGTGSICNAVVWPVLQVDREAFHFSNVQVGILAATAALAQMITYLVFSRRGVIRASNRLLALPYSLVATPIAMTVLLLVHPLPMPLRFGLLLATVVVGNIGNGLQQLYLYLVVNAMAGSASALTYHAIQNTVMGIRGVIMPIIIAIVFQHFHLLPTMLIAFTLTLLGAIIAACSPKSVRRELS